MFHHSWLRGRTVVFNPSPKPVSTDSSVNVDQASPSAVGRVFSFLRSVLRGLWRVVKGLALAIGLLIIFFFVMGIWSAAKMSGGDVQKLPQSMILSMTLDGEIPETNAATQILSLIQPDKMPLTLDDMVNSIDRAAKDTHVKALVVKAGGGGYNLSQLQSLRRAVLRFKASGKKTYIYSESYGEGGYGLGIYYLASAFDEIWMQPVGGVSIGGIDMEIPFFKDVMAQYGVEAQFFQRKEYKNAMEHLTSNQMSPASRESMTSLSTDLARQLIEPIKQSRTKLSGKLDQLVNLGMLTDKVALQEGLVDKLDYEDVLVKTVRNANSWANLISVERYAANDRQKNAEKNLLRAENAVSLAIIPVDGMIVSGSRKSSPFGDKFAAADDIVDSIKAAANDNSINTIVLRVNSPGGSPSASESIRRALIWAKTEKSKVVIVSMGALAASGGYWISTPADKIYAMDSTLTGSIGVVGGKVNLQGLWSKLGVRWESVKYGENSGMFSLNHPFSESEQKQFEASLDSIYDHFIARVAEGRNLKPEQVEKIAKGRAYTGRQAIQLGLVDQIGGFDKVLDDIAKDNKLASRDDLRLVYLPRTEDPFELAMMMFSQRIGLQPVLQKVSAMVAPMVWMATEADRRSLVYSNPAQP